MKPPNVKAHLLAVLKSHSIEAVSKREDATTSRFALITDTGGPGRSDRIVQTVQVTIGSYGSTLGVAAVLAADIEAIIHSLPAVSSSPVAAVPWATSPYESTDPDVPRLSRYVATYQLTVICR